MLTFCHHLSSYCCQIVSHLAYFPGPFTLEDNSRVIVCMHYKNCPEIIEANPSLIILFKIIEQSQLDECWLTQMCTAAVCQKLATQCHTILGLCYPSLPADCCMELCTSLACVASFPEHKPACQSVSVVPA